MPPPSPSRSAAVAALADSGVMALTGWANGPPVLPPLDLPARLVLWAAEIEELTARRGRPVRVSWEAALAGRATLLGLHRRGRVSSNGSCRLVRASDGWVALNLARPDDNELIPALTGRPGSDPWGDVEATAGCTSAGVFAAQARLLGLAAAPVPPQGAKAPADAFPVVDRWSRRESSEGPWRVIDLSSLWAGPLVARLLAEAGATVTRIESPARPDGARATPDVYRWLHSPRETTVSVDLGTPAGQRQAETLIDAADVVIEGSRPRALEQLGLGPEDRPDRDGRVWLSITGYGRDAPGRDWVAFGDDAAAAGGLLGWDEAGEPVFCGDAIADPITGLAGTLAVLRAREAGGGQLIDLAMSRAAAAVAGNSGPTGNSGPNGDPVAIEPDGAGGWVARTAEGAVPVQNGPPSLDLFRPLPR